DVVLGLDCVDLAGTMGVTPGHGVRGRPDLTRLMALGKTVINVSLDELSNRGMTTDYQALAAVDVPILSEPAETLPLLLEECKAQLDGNARARIDRRRQALESRQADRRQRQRRAVEAAWDR